MDKKTKSTTPTAAKPATTTAKQVVFRRKNSKDGMVYVDGYFKSDQEQGEMVLGIADGVSATVKVGENLCSFSGILTQGDVALNVVYEF